MDAGRAPLVMGAIAVAACLVTTTWIVARRAPEPPTAAPAAATSDELHAARAQIARLQQEVAELSGKIALLEARYGAGGISTPPTPPPPPPAPGPSSTPLKGMVLAADARAGIFLLSRGRKDGLAVGDELTVYRGDQFVAVVVVDKLFEDKCSAAVKVEDGKPLLKAGLEIKQGDLFASIY